MAQATGFHRWANPTQFNRLAEAVKPYAAAGALFCFITGLYYALFASPPDYQQGDTVRIMYIHVPAAWMSMLVYSIVAGSSAAFLIWRHPVADMIACSSAGIGAMFTFITLVTGSLWGKPMWGTWWVWDARLTSVLLLFFIYLGYMALRRGEAGERSNSPAAILAIFGLINLPVIRFSVDWWNTLHQPASVLREGGMAIHDSMLPPLFLMAGAYLLLYLYIMLLRAQTLLIRQKIRRLQLQRSKDML
jgi:heme exporter protein C